MCSRKILLLVFLLICINFLSLPLIFTQSKYTLYFKLLLSIAIEKSSEVVSTYSAYYGACVYFPRKVI